MNQYISQIQSELLRLNATTDHNAYSGLTAEVKEDQVTIFDDYERATIPEPERLLAQLKTLEPIDWSSEDNTEQAFEPIWNAVTMTGGY